MSFIDIHTHQKTHAVPEIAVVNVLEEFRRIPDTGFFSAGLHPWHLKAETAEEAFDGLETACRKKNVVAVGECGLDKACPTDYELQKTYFVRQIALANELIKPMIIHCVRAFDETLLLLRDQPCKVPVVFHGFNKSAEVAKQLLRRGYYLSFGAHLLSNGELRKVFRNVPTDQLFLETDTGPTTIETMYLAASDLKELDLALLCNRISTNARLVFGDKLLLTNE